ncbi:MAG: sugar ABC transporter permease [Chloroflexi bacterium]|nr:sugar ABC transporter permease [Chloroflexota bacterium]
MFNSELLRREAIQGYLFILPWFIGFLVFTAGPLAAALGFSFTDWNGVSAMEFIGFENYIQLSQDSRFWQSLKVTLVFTFFYLILNLIIGFALALVMNQPVRGIRIFRTIYYLPAVLSGVAVAVLWAILFHREYGALNWLLGLIGIKRVGWLVSESWALPSIIIMELWRVGSTIIIFLAGLQGIPPELYEAAEVDGANRRWRLWSITIPLMSPSIFFVLIVGFINSMQVFTQAYIMTKGGPNLATYFYSINLYITTFRELRLGYASAQAGVLFVIIFLITLGIIWVSRYRVNYELV